MRQSRRLAVAGLAALGLAATGLPSVGASATPALPAPRPMLWPASGSTVPEGIQAIQVVISGGAGGGSSSACTITATYRVDTGDTVAWIVGTGGTAGTASSGGVEPGGAGGAGAYGYDGAAGGDSSTYSGALSGGGGGGASAFEINGATRIVAGGSGGAAVGWGANGCYDSGMSWGSGAMVGGGAPLATSMSDVVAGGVGGTVGGQPGPPGTAGTGSSGAGAGQGGAGGADGASTPWSFGGGGGGGGGFAGGGGGVGASAGSSPAPGGSGGNMVVPGATGDAVPVFAEGPGSTASVFWVHLEDDDLPEAVAGSSYSHQLVATFGGAGATTPLATAAGAWEIVSGSLPPGLALNARTGVVSGEPTRSGSYNVEVSATQMVWQLERGRYVPRPAARSEASYSLIVSADPGPDPIPDRQAQRVKGVQPPKALSRTTGTVLLSRATVTSAGEPVRIRVRATPLVRSLPAGSDQLVRVVTGANGSKTLYVTTSQRISVDITYYADHTKGYRKWKLTRSYAV